MPERLVAWSRGYGRYVPRFSPSRGTAIFFRLYEENLGLGRLDAPLEKKMYISVHSKGLSLSTLSTGENRKMMCNESGHGICGRIMVKISKRFLVDHVNKSWPVRNQVDTSSVCQSCQQVAVPPSRVHSPAFTTYAKAYA